MISLTVERARLVSDKEEIFIITLADQKDAIARELGGAIPKENIVGEPVGRNTAPSIGLAALLIKKRFGDVPFLVLPADHLVEGDEQFESVVRGAGRYVADHDCLLTFGIIPSRPETGYGYIRMGKRLSGQPGSEVFDVESFHEKPSPHRAREFVDDGRFLWNSGMFCWRVETILDAISNYVPELYSVLSEIESGMGTAGLEAVLNASYQRAPATSIDYGVMEKADNVVLMKGQFYWNDVGSWESIRDIYPRDENGNVLIGEHVLFDSTDNTVFSPDRTVGVIGVDHLVIVDSGDAFLVCARDRVQQVREIVNALKKKGQKLL
jgi:mannose-1-phosphate guanylyltransferase